ncbi:MAG: sulfite exporter TauE/SafE family protein [Candidatus Binatia bacterium]
MLLDQTIILVGASLLVAAYVKGTTGMGFPTIATPIVTLFLDIRTAITILLIPNIVMDIGQIFHGHFPRAIFRRFASLLLCTVIGVFVGTKILVSVPLYILDLTLGIMVLAFVLYNLFHFDFQISPCMERILSPMVGLGGGVLNGVTNVLGPFTASYFYGLKMEKQEFVKSIATTFMVAKVSQLIAVSTWNLFTPSRLRLSLLVTLIILPGFYIGLKTQDWVDQRTFNRALLSLLFVIGVTLMVRALR